MFSFEGGLTHTWVIRASTPPEPARAGEETQENPAPSVTVDVRRDGLVAPGTLMRWLRAQVDSPPRAGDRSKVVTARGLAVTDPTLERSISDPCHQRAAAGVLLPVALGFAVSAGLLVLYVGWEFAFGHLPYVTERLSRQMLGPRIALTVIALTGFMVGGRAYGRRAMIRDLSDLGSQLSCSPTERAALLREGENIGRSAKSWIGSVMAVPVGLLLVTGQSPGEPYLLSNEPWNHDSVWALAANVVLFSVLGRMTVEMFRTNEFFARIETRLAPVNLLRPQVLAPFARRGLRNAFLWIGGSSLASIIFVAQGFSWLTGLVLLCSLLMGTLAFLLPVRGLHRRIRTAKEAELERLH